MTLHVFADRGLMLAETAGLDPNSLPGVRFTAYSQQRQPGRAARVFQALHIAARPFSLRLSAWAAFRFNDHLAVPPDQLAAGLAAVLPGDRVLWLNPTRALVPVVDGLIAHGAKVSVYFLDPVHRLGLMASTLRRWSASMTLSSYWPAEAERLGMLFLAPHAPAVAANRVAPDSLAQQAARTFDVVYVGSPSPKRLLWVLALQWQLKRRGGRGHLRLASRNESLHRWFPRVFSARVPFAEYAALCAQARGVLELHERDAGGVTQRATLCEVLQTTHLCNQAATPQTVQVSLWRWSRFDTFLRSAGAQPPRLGALPLEAWLRQHFS